MCLNGETWVPYYDVRRKELAKKDSRFNSLCLVCNFDISFNSFSSARRQLNGILVGSSWVDPTGPMSMASGAMASLDRLVQRLRTEREEAVLTGQVKRESAQTAGLPVNTRRELERAVRRSEVWESILAARLESYAVVQKQHRVLLECWRPQQGKLVKRPTISPDEDELVSDDEDDVGRPCEPLYYRGRR